MMRAEELSRVGADTFIRVGTSGSMQPGQRAGELAIVTGAIRDEQTSRQYLPLEFPALAHHQVVAALAKAAAQQGVPAHLGVTHSKDAFYAEVEPERLPLAERLRTNWQAWVAGGAICSEMEASALFILASLYRRRAGGVMLLAGGQDEISHHDTSGAIRVAVEALRILIAEDKITQVR